VTLSPITGGFAIALPADKPEAAKLTFTGSAKVTPAQVAGLALFADFVVQSIGSIGSALANVDNEHAAAAGATATRLAALAGTIHGDITAISSAVTAALGGESQLEVSAECDFGARQCEIQFATINTAGEAGKAGLQGRRSSWSATRSRFRSEIGRHDGVAPCPVTAPRSRQRNGSVRVSQVGGADRADEEVG
jgi:hypothetical protein